MRPMRGSAGLSQAELCSGGSMSRRCARLFAALLTVSLLFVTGLAHALTFDDALTALDKKDYATALRQLRALAERGDVRAQRELGRMYAKGEGVAKDEAESAKWFNFAKEQADAVAAYNRGDFDAALKAFRPAAEKGQVLAAYMLGLMYANGQGVAENYPEALQWLRKAGEQGEAKAQFAVGVIYFKGLGTPKNDAEAFKWYRRAADQGLAVAQFNLGAMYAKGQSVTADPVTAHMLYSLAAARGIKPAAAARDQLAQSMTAEQIAQAVKLAKAWTPKPEFQ